MVIYRTLANSNNLYEWIVIGFLVGPYILFRITSWFTVDLPCFIFVPGHIDQCFCFLI